MFKHEACDRKSILDFRRTSRQTGVHQRSENQKVLQLFTIGPAIERSSEERSWSKDRKDIWSVFVPSAFNWGQPVKSAFGERLESLLLLFVVFLLACSNSDHFELGILECQMHSIIGTFGEFCVRNRRTKFLTTNWEGCVATLKIVPLSPTQPTRMTPVSYGVLLTNYLCHLAHNGVAALEINWNMRLSVENDLEHLDFRSVSKNLGGNLEGFGF